MTVFAVVSDTHGDRACMIRALDYLQALRPDALIHLGDFWQDGEFLSKELKLPLFHVRGNCDYGSTAEETRVIECEGEHILLCHGHQFHVQRDLLSLAYAAREKECSAALFGHTHIQTMEKEAGVLLLNPGSLCRPRQGDAGLALLRVEKERIQGVLLPYRGGA